VVVGLGLALRFGPLLLRGLVGLLREMAAVVRGTPLALLPVLIVVVVLVLVLRRSRPRRSDRRDEDRPSPPPV
jgi:hypothetical protein